MTLALITTNLKNQTIKRTTAANSSKNTEKLKPQKNNQYKEAESKMETHLTVIGVRTTIRPENSGT